MALFDDRTITGTLNQKLVESTNGDFNVASTPLYNSVTSITGTIDAGLDAFGIRQAVKHKCVMCGKSFGYLPFDGFCSFECFSKWALKNITNNYDVTDSFITNIFNMVQSITRLISGSLNLIGSIPTLIHQVDYVPEFYRDFLKQKISWLFTYVDIEIDELMIKKNKYIIEHILDPIINKKVYKQIGKNIEWIQSALGIVQQMQIQLEISYKAAKQALKNQSTILPESYAFYETARTKNKQPQQHIWNIPTETNLVRSLMNDKNIQSISKFLKVGFPPIEEVEYFVDEGVFNARLLASALNAKNIAENIKTLNKLLKLGGQYLPPYEELSLTNPNFDVAIYFGWGVMSQWCFGCPNPIYP